MKRIRRHPGQEGFTLIELLTVMVIIGILASVAIPGFMHYVRKSKGTEVFDNLEKLASGARIYFDKYGTLPKSTGKAPLKTLAEACTSGFARFEDTDLVDFGTPEWVDLLFRPGSNFRYRYEWELVDATLGHEVGVARAEGDLDCDGNRSLLEVHLKREGLGKPLMRHGVWRVINDETE